MKKNEEVHIRMEWNELTQQLEIKEKTIRPIQSTIYDKRKPNEPR